VFVEETASAPPRNEAPASSAMSADAGVSFTHTGTRATAFTACVVTEHRTLSLPMCEPMSTRSMCGQLTFSSIASTPASWTALVRICQLSISLSEPDPAMTDATSTRSGKARLIASRRGTHQSSGLSLMSSQFQLPTSVAPGRFVIDRRVPPLSTRRNFVLGPRTFVTGWSPIVFVTTPPQPAS
jgi:hypothetical protein